MRTIRLLAALAVAAAFAAPTRAAELKKLHVLLAFDTNSNLSAQLLKDKARLTSLLRHNIPGRRMEIKYLIGNRLTPAQVRAYYKSLKVTKDDGVFFFYGGHGAYNRIRGHVLQFQQGRQPMLRSELLSIMKAKKAGLVVVLTDCCANFVKLSYTPRKTGLPEGKDLSPVFRHLFFLNRGVADINATSPGDVSWGDNVRGGLFTYTLCGALMTPFSRLKKDKNGNLTWAVFYPQLRTHTANYFQRWRRKMIEDGERISSRSQVPHKFAVSDESLRKQQPPKKAGARSVAVNLVNRSDGQMGYSYRWDDEKEFKRKKLDRGKEFLHMKRLPAKGNKAPLLIVKVDGYKNPVKLQGRVFSGDKPKAYQVKSYVFGLTKRAAGVPPLADPHPPVIGEEEDD